MMVIDALNWISGHWPEFDIALERHLAMSAAAMAIALSIGVPLAIAITKANRWSSAVIGAVNALRTIPSLAILALMMPLMGIGLGPSIVALTVLALPPILINAFIGLRDADPAATEAAQGIGMTPMQVMRKIRLPLALPALFAGTRTAAVQVLAGATLAPFIGGGGLGDFIAVGIGMMDPARILVGAVPIALLAFAAEFLFAAAERVASHRRTA